MENETTIKTEQPHSVKISRNAKGDVAIEVKCYGETPEVSLQNAKKIFDATKAELGL